MKLIFAILLACATINGARAQGVTGVGGSAFQVGGNLNSSQVVQYDYYPSTGNTNTIGFLVSGTYQGVANNGSNIFLVGTGAIQKESDINVTNLSTFVATTQVTNGLSNFGKDYHLGDGDWYGGYLFEPLEADVGGNSPLGRTNLGIAIYDGVNGGNIYKYFSVSNVQIEISAITVGMVSNSPTVFASAFLGSGTVSSNNTIFEYSTSSLTNLTFVKALTLNTNLYSIQGLKFIKGKLYALCDQEDGFGTQSSSGRVFEIDVTNQTARLFTEINVSGQSEWEGLDYYTHTTNTDNDGLVLASEGSTGIWIYNWFSPIVTSNNVFTGRFVGSIGNTWDAIQKSQLPQVIFSNQGNNGESANFWNVTKNNVSLYDQYNLISGGFIDTYRAVGNAGTSALLMWGYSGTLGTAPTIANSSFGINGLYKYVVVGSTNYYGSTFNVTGASTFNGSISITNGAINSVTNVAPVNTSTPVWWIKTTNLNSGAVGEIPVYQ